MQGQGPARWRRGAPARPTARAGTCRPARRTGRPSSSSSSTLDCSLRRHLVDDVGLAEQERDAEPRRQARDRVLEDHLHAPAQRAPLTAAQADQLAAVQRGAAAVAGTRPITVRASVDLPEPDSPDQPQGLAAHDVEADSVDGADLADLAARAAGDHALPVAEVRPQVAHAAGAAPPGSGRHAVTPAPVTPSGARPLGLRQAARRRGSSARASRPRRASRARARGTRRPRAPQRSANLQPGGSASRLGTRPGIAASVVPRCCGDGTAASRARV